MRFKRDFKFWVLLAVALLGLVTILGDTNTAHAQCNDGRIEWFSIDPSGTLPQGTHVAVSISGNCGTARILVNGQHKAEEGVPNISTTIKTEEFPAGTLEICGQLRDDSGGWDAADTRCTSVEVYSNQMSPNTDDESVQGSAPPAEDQPPSGDGQSASSQSYPDPNDTSSHGMNITGWCQSMGHANSRATGDAYSWICINADESRARDVDMDAVCRHNYGDQYPYAWLSDPNDHRSWSCRSTPQGSRPARQEPTVVPQNQSSSQQNSNSQSSQNGCNTLPPRMNVPGTGRVTQNGGGPTTLWNSRSLSGTRLERMPEGATFEVLAGPFCVEGKEGELNSYQIRYEGTTGYASEGYAGGDYWIEPWSGATSNNNAPATGSSGSLGNVGSNDPPLPNISDVGISAPDFSDPVEIVPSSDRRFQVAFDALQDVYPSLDLVDVAEGVGFFFTESNNNWDYFCFGIGLYPENNVWNSRADYSCIVFGALTMNPFAYATITLNPDRYIDVWLDPVHGYLGEISISCYFGIAWDVAGSECDRFRD